MMKHMGTLAGFVAAVALLAGCGSSSGSSGNAGSPSGANSNTTVQVEHSSALNANVLTNKAKMTLYTLSAEKGGKFICTQSSMIPGTSTPCVSVWLPATVAQGTTLSGPVSLGTISRPDGGGTQLTYKGLPLYTFANDKAPGDASGNGFKDVGTWKAVTIGSAASAPATTSNSGSGYGYRAGVQRGLIRR